MTGQVPDKGIAAVRRKFAYGIAMDIGEVGCRRAFRASLNWKQSDTTPLRFRRREFRRRPENNGSRPSAARSRIIPHYRGRLLCRCSHHVGKLGAGGRGKAIFLGSLLLTGQIYFNEPAWPVVDVAPRGHWLCLPCNLWGFHRFMYDVWPNKEL